MIRNKIVKLFLPVLFGVFTMSTVHAVQEVREPTGKYTYTLEVVGEKRIVNVTKMKTHPTFIESLLKLEQYRYRESDILRDIGDEAYPTCLTFKGIKYEYDGVGTVTVTGEEESKGEALRGGLIALHVVGTSKVVNEEVVKEIGGEPYFVKKPKVEEAKKGSPFYTINFIGNIKKIEECFCNQVFVPFDLKKVDMSKSRVRTIGNACFNNCPELTEFIPSPFLRKIYTGGEFINAGDAFGKSIKLSKETKQLIVSLYAPPH